MPIVPSDRRSWRALLALLAVLSLFAAACGGDDEDAESDDTEEGSDAAAILGEEDKAAGEVLTVGFISDGKSDAVDNSSEIGAAEAATTYVNTHLGGIGGRRLALKVCENGQTPAGATQCVNEMVAAKVPVVLLNVSGQSGTIVKGLNEAGIPSFWWTSLDTSVGTSPTAFVITNGLAAAFGGPAKLAKDSGATQAAEIVIDLPGISGAAKLIAAPIYKNAGVALDIIPVAPGTGDMAPQVKAALDKNPGMVHITGNDTFCISAIKALQTLGYDGPVTMVPQCLTQALIDGVPGGLKGYKVLTVETRDPDDDEFELYHAVMDTYGKDTEASGSVTSGGYAAVIGFARAAKGLTGDATPASVQAAIRAMASATMPLASELTFKCDGMATSISKPICSTATLVATLDGAGKPGNYGRVDSGELLKLG